MRKFQTSIIEGSTTAENSEVLGDDAAFACSDDPVADEEWTAEYEEEIRQADILEEKMQKRPNGTTDISEWYSIIILQTLCLLLYISNFYSVPIQYCNYWFRFYSHVTYNVLKYSIYCIFHLKKQ